MKVILTTDGSASAEKAIHWFSRLPICRASELLIVTVEGVAVNSIYAPEINVKIGLEEKLHAEKAFHRANKILEEAGCSATHCPRIGHAADEIIRFAEEMAADLIVIGARGRSMLAKVLLGSTSDAVATHARCSVLVVRHPENVESDSRFRLLLALDGSEKASVLIGKVASMQWPPEAEATLVTAIQHPALLDEDEPYDRYLTASMNAALEDGAKKLAGCFANVSKQVLEEVHVGNSILNFANESNTDLIAIGDTGHSAISRFFIGSVSRFVLHHAACSVLLIRS